jgi:hypothetical protein
MGVRSGRDLLSSKYVTAMITDSTDRVIFVPIKYVVGDYFVAKINNETYVFSMAGRKYTYYDFAAHSFQIMYFNTSHYKPISPPEVKELELVTIKNNLPKIDGMLFNIIKILGKREKNPFTEHKIKDLKEYILQKANTKGASEYVEQAQSIVNYLDHLEIDKIVTPLKRIGDFIEGEILQTDPKFLGSIADAILDVDLENRKINNIPIKSKTAWIKIIAILSLIGLIGAVLYIAYEGGAFDSLVAPLEGIGDIDFNLGGGISPDSVMSQYPTAESLRAAVDSGKVDYNSLPQLGKDLYNSVEPPK